MKFACSCGMYEGPIAWECATCGEHVVMPAMQCPCGQRLSENHLEVEPTEVCWCGTNKDCGIHYHLYQTRGRRAS